MLSLTAVLTDLSLPSTVVEHVKNKLVYLEVTRFRSWNFADSVLGVAPTARAPALMTKANRVRSDHTRWTALITCNRKTINVSKNIDLRVHVCVRGNRDVLDLDYSILC